MKKLRQFLKVESKAYPDIKVTWSKGKKPIAYLKDKDGQIIKQKHMKDLHHADNLKWLKQHFDFVPTSPTYQYGKPVRAFDAWGHHYETYGGKGRYQDAVDFAANLEWHGKRGYPIVVESESELDVTRTLAAGRGAWLGVQKSETGAWSYAYGNKAGTVFRMADNTVVDGQFDKFSSTPKANKPGWKDCATYLPVGWMEESCVSHYQVIVEFGDADDQDDSANKPVRSKDYSTWMGPAPEVEVEVEKAPSHDEL